MTKIETHRSRVPWSWVVWMTGPWLALYYIDNVNGGPLTFTIRKFIENPALIGFLTSLNVAFNFLIGVAASYMSDRIWTRWGRRRPFLIVGWTGVAIAMACVPFAPNVWVLGAIVVAYQFFADIAKPVEPLHNEVIPPGQRGRAASVQNIGQQLLGLVFFGVLLAQFDHVHEFTLFGHDLHLAGETVLYWCGSALLFCVVLFLAFRLRETPPPERVTREPFALRTFFREVFGQRQWWMIYLLYVTPMIAAPTGNFHMLLRTDQLGFTKEQLGYAITFGLIVMILVFAPLGGYLADRMSRMRLLRIGLIGPAIVEFVFFLHLRYVAHYSISLSTLIIYGTIAGAMATCMYIVWGPLTYDYIPSERYGTVAAGLTFVGGLVPFLTINLTGLWITGFTKIFGPIGGGHYDYSSMFLFQLAGAALALGLTYYFEREERRGRIRPFGRLERAAESATKM
jgi:MFS family permease